MPVSFDLTSYSRTTFSDGNVNRFVYIDVPPNVENNDLLFAVIHSNNGSNPGGIVPPAGWTQIASNFNTNGNFAAHSWLGYKIARSEPEYYTWDITASTASSGGNDDHGWMFRITGHSISNPIDVIGAFTSTSTLNPVAASITTTKANSFAVWSFAAKNGNNLAADDTSLSPVGTTQLLFKKSRVSSVAIASLFASEVISSSGATGTRTFTGTYPTTSSYSSTIGFALVEPTWPVIRKIGVNETIRSGSSGIVATGNNLSGQTSITLSNFNRTNQITVSSSNATAVVFDVPGLSSILTSNLKFGDCNVGILTENTRAVLLPPSGYSVHDVIDISQNSSIYCIYNGQGIKVGDQILYDTANNTFIDSQGFPSLSDTTKFNYYLFDSSDNTWGSVGTYDGYAIKNAITRSLRVIPSNDGKRYFKYPNKMPLLAGPPLVTLTGNEQSNGTVYPGSAGNRMTYDNTRSYTGTQSMKLQLSQGQPPATCGGSHFFGGRFTLPTLIPEGYNIWYRARFYFPSTLPLGYNFGTGDAADAATCGKSADGPGFFKFLVFAPDVLTSRLYVMPPMERRGFGLGASSLHVNSEAENIGDATYPWTVPRDQWFSLQTQVKVSSVTGGGFIRVWIDDQYILQHNVATIANSSYKMKEWGIGDYWNGVPWTDGQPTTTDSFWMDDVIIATDYTGYGAPLTTDSGGRPFISNAVTVAGLS